MQRLNWMNFAVWTIPVVCLFIAFGLGWYFYGHLVQAQGEYQEVEKAVAQTNVQIDELKKNIPTDNIVTVPSTPEEEAEFTRELETLRMASGVKIRSITKTDPAVLPDIATATAAATSSSSSSADKPFLSTGSVSSSKATPQSTPPSIKNLPGGAKAISHRVVVSGSYLTVRNFLYRLYNYRYIRRTININEARLSSSVQPNAPPLVEADIVITRFVSPPNKRPASALFGAAAPSPG